MRAVFPRSRALTLQFRRLSQDSFEAFREELKVRLPPALLAALAILGALPVIRSLVVPDLNWCYPYMTADSYDWINNGLYWAGASVAPSLRPPGFPLLIAVLWKLGALPFLPVVNFLFLGLSTAALYALLRERHDAWIAATACWFFFANGLRPGPFSIRHGRDVCDTVPRPGDARVRQSRARAEGVDRIRPLPRRRVPLLDAAVPVAVGFGVAFVAVSRGDLRRSELWAGLIASAIVVGGWITFRWSFYRAHPRGPRHGVEALIRPSLSNLSSYAYAAIALMGLVPLALYLAGALRFVRSPSPPPRWRAAVLGPLTGLALFFGFAYDWADKRFLLYALPFLVCFLAEGLALLRDLARKGAVAAVASAGFLALALLWNQIRYPSYGIEFLALTPVHFLQAGLTFTPAAKAVLHLERSAASCVPTAASSRPSRGDCFDLTPRRDSVPRRGYGPTRAWPC